MKKAIPSAISETRRSELEALAALPDDQINTRALPEQLDWSGARRGVFFVPSKSN
jgi:hypothetical protein